MGKNTQENSVDSQAAVEIPTVEAYLAGDRSARAKIRASVTALVSSRLHADDLIGAKAANDALAAYKLAAGTATDKPETNWSQLTADRIATLRLAADMLAQQDAQIDGVPTDYVWDTDLPEGTADADAARAMATKRVTRSGPTHNVAEGIRQAFANEPDGTVLTVAEIGRRWVAAGGPSNNSGRIAARLFADVCTVTGVVPVPATADSPRGAKKVGDWS